MSSDTIRRWRFVHEWSSLVCTVFLLMLCLTGLPLVFHEEIDDWLQSTPAVPAAATPATAATMPEPAATGAMPEPVLAHAGRPASPDMDRVVRRVRDAYPDRPIQFVVWLEEAGQFRVGLGRTSAQRGQKPFALVDGFADRIVGEAWSEKDWRNGGVMSVLLMLHTNLLLGLGGQLFLGAMGLLFVVSLVSGVVLYAPFTRKLAFGTIRRERAPRVAWLDLHNLIGIATVLWALVVGVTGAINTLDSMVFGAWQRQVSATIKAEYGGAPPLRQPDGLQRAVTTALAFLPHKSVSFVAYPGSMFGTPAHFAVYLRGDSPLTSRLLHPVLIDARDGRLIDVGDPPWYLWALEVSRPLHFGDYGGLPMKLLWAGFDLLAIVVLGSGLYLWVARRRGAVGGSRPGGRPTP